MGVGRFDVFDDEKLFAGLDEAQVAAGEVFDRGRVLAEASSLITQPRVLGADSHERLLERLVLVTLLQHLHQPLLTDKAVEHEHTSDEQDQILHDTTTATPECLAARRRGWWGSFHVTSCENSAFFDREYTLIATSIEKVHDKDARHAYPIRFDRADDLWQR